MANRRHNKQVGHAMPTKGHFTGRRGPLKQDAPEKTAAWPGIPGKAQPGGKRTDRANTPRVRQHMKSEGI